MRLTKWKVDIFTPKLTMMECIVHFYLLNKDFSEEVADQNGGAETEDNYRYDWEDALKITTDVSEVVVHDYATFPLRGEMPDGDPFTFDVENMRLFELKGEQPLMVGCSERIIDSYDLLHEEAYILRVYLKYDEPMANPVPGIYIASQEFPKQLAF